MIQITDMAKVKIEEVLNRNPGKLVRVVIKGAG